MKFKRLFVASAFCLSLSACQEFTVTKTADTNDGECSTTDCSLREAVIAANDTFGLNTITLPAGTYLLTRTGEDENTAATGDLDLLDEVTINGAGAASTIIDGNMTDRVLDAFLGLLTLNNVTIQHGRTYRGGAGIRVNSTAQVRMNNVIIQNNQEHGPISPAVSNTPPSTGQGAGLYSEGDVNLRNVQFLTNQNISDYFDGGPSAANGAGMYVTGPKTSITGYSGATIQVNLSDVRFYNNRVEHNGGAIALGSYVHANLNNIDMEHNGSYAGNGGALYFSPFNDDQRANSSLRVTDSHIYDSWTKYWGGGFYIGGNVEVHRSTFDNNHAEISGGGIEASSNSDDDTFRLLLKDSTLMDNSAGYSGGGVWVNSGVDLENMTLSGNEADFGGGIAINSNATIANSTIVNNHANTYGGGLSLTIIGYYLMKNTIIANNTRTLKVPDEILEGVMSFTFGAVKNNCVIDLHTDEAFPAFSLGHNLSNDETCGLFATGDMITEPNLGPLGDNGGPTQTHALLKGSPAIDGGTNLECTEDDQRGYPRPVAGSIGGTAICDIGAFEYQLLPVLIDVPDKVL